MPALQALPAVVWCAVDVPLPLNDDESNGFILLKANEVAAVNDEENMDEADLHSVSLGSLVSVELLLLLVLVCWLWWCCLPPDSERARNKADEEKPLFLLLLSLSSSLQHSEKMR